MKIKFNTNGNQLQVVKAIVETLKVSLHDAKEIADKGEVEVSDPQLYRDLYTRIDMAGGRILKEPSVEDVVLPKPISNIVDLIKATNAEKINDVYVTSNVALEITLISKIGVTERLHQVISTVCVKELKNIQKHIRLVSGFTTEKNGNSAVSVLAIRVPDKHNTIEDTMVLGTIVRMIHECILDKLSSDFTLDNIEKDLKPFYDE